MIIPDKPHNEVERLKALHSYAVMDTISEKEYNQLTAIASEICGCSMSLISLLDENRQWFKSRVGLAVTETPREYAFCGHAIQFATSPLIVEDARLDNRFHDNPLVTGDPNLVFYAGIPLVNDEGFALGTLCVLDQQPKQLTGGQLSALKALSDQVMALLELRRSKIFLEQSLRKLEEKNRDLEQFAFIAAHDLKSPLNGISTLTELLMDSHAEALREDGLRMMSAIKGSSAQLSGMISGLLEYYRLDATTEVPKELLPVDAVRSKLMQLFAGEDQLAIDFETSIVMLNCNGSAVCQILVNLISNAVKYGDKDLTQVTIRIEEFMSHYLFEVSDNGPGIPEDQHHKLFQLFSIITPHDRKGQKGNGLGLATVKKLVYRMGGDVSLQSSPGKGLTIRFSVLK
jgi:signal transduction histidine kinase